MNDFDRFTTVPEHYNESTWPLTVTNGHETDEINAIEC
jgi:hypothetical protein